MLLTFDSRAQAGGTNQSKNPGFHLSRTGNKQAHKHPLFDMQPDLRTIDP